jgi:hypothetical protein
MPRSPASALGFALCILACTDAGDSSPPATPTSFAPASPVTDHATPPPAVPPEPLEALALRCDGPAIAAQLATLPTPHDTPSARLLVTWEAARVFTSANTLDPKAVDALTTALTTELGSSPPAWWTAHLASATVGAGPAAYDIGPDPHTNGDRRGPYVPGPGRTQIRPGNAGALAAANGKLFFDLSMGRVELGPLPAEAHVIELSRARAGSTIYYASFDRGAGGVRFPLYAIARDGQQLWRAEVCGPDRKVLGGRGHLTVEIVVVQPPPDPDLAPGTLAPSPPPTGIAVFTAESHGVALDVFDPSTGERTLAWSSELWFAR